MFSACGNQDCPVSEVLESVAHVCGVPPGPVKAIFTGLAWAKRCGFCCKGSHETPLLKRGRGGAAPSTCKSNSWLCTLCVLNVFPVSGCFGGCSCASTPGQRGRFCGQSCWTSEISQGLRALAVSAKTNLVSCVISGSLSYL